MRRAVLTIAAALAFANAVFAVDWSIRDIDVHVRLYTDGSAVISETWNMTAEEGTEVYIPKENLGKDIQISRFSVTDESGSQYEFVDHWNLDGSLRQKALKCGIHKTGSGVELCWGLGSYGPHKYRIQYVMSNVVRSLEDYDMLHLQLVNDEMAAPPAHVKVTVEAQPQQIDTSWVRIWGFGYAGTTAFEDGKAVFESSEHFRYESSVIALMRFDKGIFSPEVSEDKDFSAVQEKAFRGSDYHEYVKTPWWKELLQFLYSLFFAFIFFLPFILALRHGKMTKRQKRKLLGSDPDKVQWYRDLPFKGDIYKTDFVLDTFETKRQSNAVASAIILRLLQKGYLTANKDDKGKVEIYFSDFADISKLDSHELGLYNMMKEASGSDTILQDKEFSKWSMKKANQSLIRSWATEIESDAKVGLRTDNVYAGRKFTESGKVEAQHVFGFRNFLRDFTLVDKRESVEVALWQDYLVYASLFGIADQVAKELKDIDPQAFDEVVLYDYNTYNDVIRMTNHLANSITNARSVPAQSAGIPGGGSFGGFGGGASFGGGGGFYGGGHGGGVR